MDVVIVAKTTVYESKGDLIAQQVGQGRLPRSYLENVKQAHEDHNLALRRLYRELEKHQIPYQEFRKDSNWPDSIHEQVIIAIGGDGTALVASHLLRGKEGLLLGIRSSNLSIGHLCAYAAQEIDKAIYDLASDNLTIKTAHRLFARVYNFQTRELTTTPPILNDFLFTHEHPAATTRYEIKQGPVKETQRSSGLWVSTAAGSTAAMRAAGGEIMDMEDDRFQYMVREPYRPSRESGQLISGFFDLRQESFEITNQCEKAILAVDGHHHGTMSLQWGDRISFARAQPICIVRPHQ